MLLAQGSLTSPSPPPGRCGAGVWEQRPGAASSGVGWARADGWRAAWGPGLGWG